MKILQTQPGRPSFSHGKTSSRLQKTIMLIAVLAGAGIIISGFQVGSKADDISLAEDAIAYAYPVSGIKIDGDISDWPETLTHYKIQNITGKGLKNKEDLEASFQAGYNVSDQSLYFAVTISDNSHLADTSEKAGWDTQDTYNFFIDKKHLPSGSGVVKYQFNEKWKQLFNPDDSWDPEVKEANWNDLEFASRLTGSNITYEFRIKLEKQVYPGRSVGIDHTVVDKDAEDSTNIKTYASWGKDEGKDFSPGKIGYLILMRGNETTGTLNGQLKWKDKSIKGFPGKIRITAIHHPALWVQASVDSTGRYSLALPQDIYKITPVWSFVKDGDSLYKIDRKSSFATVTLNAKENVNAPVLELSTLIAPDLIPEKGILQGFDNEKAIQLDKFIKVYQDYYEIPGVSLALIKNGEVIYHKTYGVKNTYTQEPVDENTLFEAASVTKPVFAFAVNRLAERGIIDLDKPLYQYLPFEEIAYDERYKLITARHVLCHQTGFPNWAYMNKAGKLDLKFTPGTSFGYSGEGYEYLKRVVAHITNKDIGTVLEEEVLRPLGLKSTYFAKSDYLARVVSHGHYDNLPNRADLPESPGMAWSMHTEANSFTTFVLALLNRKGMKPETYDEMFKVQTVVPLDEDDKKQGVESFFGLGIALKKTPFGSAFGHSGNNGDFKCQFILYKDLNLGFVIFTNSNTGGMLAYDPITEFLITGKQKK
jgi:CubicO group peptidase (beta-lactamase class C family)